MATKRIIPATDGNQVHVLQHVEGILQTEVSQITTYNFYKYIIEHFVYFEIFATGLFPTDGSPPYRGGGV
jgi:hypothetical protein